MPRPDEILSYFAVPGGLKCLPNFVKQELHEELTGFFATIPDPEGAHLLAELYWDANLRVVVDQIEPLAHEPGHPFAKLCADVATLPGKAELCHSFALSHPGTGNPVDWLNWAAEAQFQPARCLSLLAAFWAQPVHPSLLPADVEAHKWGQTGESLLHLGRPDHSVALLEAHLGLRPADYSGPAALHTALTRPSCPLPGLAANNQAKLLRTLADALRFVSGRGSGQAVLLLETWLGLTPDDYAHRAALQAALSRPGCALRGLEANNQADSVSTLAEGLAFVSRRGRGQAALLLETHLGLTRDDYADHAALQGALSRPGCPLPGLAANNQGAFVSVLAEALRFLSGRGGGQAALLLETWLGLTPGDYADHVALQAALSRPGCPLASLAADNQANCVGTLAKTLQPISGWSCRRATLLLETWLALTPGDYADHVALQAALSRPGCPLAGLAADNQAVFVAALAEALRLSSGRGRRQAALLLEVFLGQSLANFATATTMRGVTPLNQLWFAQAGLRALGAGDARLVPLCQAIVEYVRAVRDNELPSYEHVVEFLGVARQVWEDIERSMLEAADRLRGSGGLRESERLERRLLYWREQFENRLLFERLLGAPRWADDGAVSMPGWHPGRWGLDSPWDEPAVRARLGNGTQPRLQPAVQTACLRSMGAPLSAASAAAETVVVNAGARGNDRRQILADLPERSLEQLVPSGTVWIRTLFDEQGRLRWWAYRREAGEQTDGTFTALARGLSAAGAEQRLTLATLAFDLAVERIWFQAEDAALNPAVLMLLQSLPEWAANKSLPPGMDAQSADLEAAVWAAIEHLWQHGLSRLAQLSWTLWQQAAGDETVLLDGVVDLFERELRLLEAPRPQFETVPRGDWLQEQLNDASRAHLEAVQAEFDLAPLWQACGEDFPWAETDVLWQVAGPLWAYPLAWLELGGEPLFRRAASSGTAVSLTLRDYSEREAPETLPAGLLSAQWEQADPQVRSQRHGLPYLHWRLHELGDAGGWPVWSLGDDPQADSRNLQAALSRKEHGLVVIGAHGNDQRAGVALSDGVWCGEGADLSAVDLLILVCCAVGRLGQEGNRDVAGLYAQLAGQGARSVIAARWPIADIEAAEFAAAIAEEYLKAAAGGRRPPGFGRARALNEARKRVLDGEDSYRVSFHLAAAFEIYGLG